MCVYISKSVLVGGGKLTIAETPSMIIKMMQDRVKNMKNAATRYRAPPMPVEFNAGAMVMDHSTADSC
jgi:hypothetical protein